jgi:hypothetical protein
MMNQQGMRDLDDLNNMGYPRVVCNYTPDQESQSIKDEDVV